MNIEDFLLDIQENGVEEFDLTRIRHQLSMAAGYASYASEMVSNYQMRVDSASVKILQEMEESGEYKKYNKEDREKIVGQRIGTDYYNLMHWERRLKSLDNLCIRISTISKSLLDEWERSGRPSPS